MATLETISSIDTAPRHPIRLVANRTGLTVDLIRAWEKRYHVVEPARSDTKRRLYSDYDIERLRLIRIAKQNGRRLVDVAPMSLEALRDVVSEDSRFDAAQDNQA
ncbi:MAG: MerR family transcriptional regulator, partial [Litorivicinaceae bacterium]